MITPEVAGAFTGGISAGMLKSMGIEWALAGHSERRTLHSETSELVHKKAEKAHENNLKTIICIGETESEKESGKTQDVLKSQILESIANYEPRVDNVRVEVLPEFDNNALEVTVIYDIIGQDLPTQEYTFILEATR